MRVELQSLKMQNLKKKPRAEKHYKHWEKEKTNMKGQGCNKELERAKGSVYSEIQMEQLRPLAKER